MKRTNLFLRFIAGNRRLLLLILLLLIGCVSGMIVFRSLQSSLSESFVGLLQVRRITGGLRGGFSQLFSSCFQSLVLLVLLFISGLSACGAPVALAVPIFWGIGLGMAESFYYTAGGSGIALVALVILPHSFLEAAALLIGCAESLRLSLQLSGQLLPHGAHCGGLWQGFRLYCVRFLLLLPVLLAAGALDVGMRALLLRFFPASLIL